jgi:hypothetical protein
MERTGTYYLNNRGDRWVNLINGRREQITLKTKSGKEIKRRVIYYDSFGNFAIACISYKGKKTLVFTDTILDD